MELHLSVQLVAVVDEEVTPQLPAATPLLRPAGGVPAIIDTEAAFDAAIEELSQGTGPFAFDAERASGFKYSARAYLIQIKRTNGGLHLIDPIPFGPGHRCFVKLNEIIQGVEVILHASTQDLPAFVKLVSIPIFSLIQNSVDVLQAFRALVLVRSLKPLWEFH